MIRTQVFVQIANVILARHVRTTLCRTVISESLIPISVRQPRSGQ